MACFVSGSWGGGQEWDTCKSLEDMLMGSLCFRVWTFGLVSQVLSVTPRSRFCYAQGKSKGMTWSLQAGSIEHLQKAAVQMQYSCTTNCNASAALIQLIQAAVQPQCKLQYRCSVSCSTAHLAVAALNSATSVMAACFKQLQYKLQYRCSSSCSTAHLTVAAPGQRHLRQQLLVPYVLVIHLHTVNAGRNLQGSGER